MAKNKKENSNKNTKEKKEPGYPLLILSMAIVILILVSFVPLSKESNGLLKDYDLFADLSDSPAEIESNTDSYIDPDLLAINLDEIEDPEPQKETKPANVIIIKESTHPFIEDNDNEIQPEATTEEKSNDFQVSEEYELAPEPQTVKPGNGKIEDYTPWQVGLTNLRRALNQGRLARIAVIGDSYIEGDIFTQDVREKLQEQYGGSGVGYLPASSKLTGFRTSVNQACQGWKEYDFRTSGKQYPTLQGFYYSPSGNAVTTVKGSNKKTHAETWAKSQMLFVAPHDMTIYVSTDNGDQTFDVTGSEEVQQILLEGTTSSFKVSSSDPSLVVLGLYTDGLSGVALDNMSIRGYSGIKHGNISKELADQMRKYVDYDLIVIEYGTNALSSKQSDYSGYTKIMTRVIEHIRECYPMADILIMGIGDRGEKAGTDIRSMPVVQKMIDEQRSMARNLGVLFWDTRAAMGGENAVVDWARTGHINKDYIHLSSKGGERLSRLFVESLNKALND
ncbi:MAG: hypothetical protein K2O43_05820 [Muribaculaceae bacterium]|nr:hypothetical protein [Muribaculaceae bacterium]